MNELSASLPSLIWRRSFMISTADWVTLAYIGSVCVMVAIAVVSPEETSAPSDTFDWPIKPEIGAVMRE